MGFAVSRYSTVSKVTLGCIMARQHVVKLALFSTNAVKCFYIHRLLPEPSRMVVKLRYPSPHVFYELSGFKPVKSSLSAPFDIPMKACFTERQAAKSSVAGPSSSDAEKTMCSKAFKLEAVLSSQR